MWNATMNFQYFFSAYYKNKKLSHLIISFYLLMIWGLGIIGYAADFSHTDDTPIIALQSATIIYNNNEVTFLKLIDESISLPLINKLYLLTRAPPYNSNKSVYFLKTN